MFLCITFSGEIIPFMLDMATEAECLRAISKARELGYTFDERNYVIEADRIVLHAHPVPDVTANRRRRVKKRYYMSDLDGQILLVTSIHCPDEISPTKELLSYERGIPVDKISVTEM